MTRPISAIDVTKEKDALMSLKRRTPSREGRILFLKSKAT